MAQRRRRSSAVGLLGHSRVVFQELPKSVHDLAPFYVGRGAIDPLSGGVPTPREPAGESAGDRLGEHSRARVTFLPAREQPLGRYVRRIGLGGSRKRYCGKNASNDAATLADGVQPSGTGGSSAAPQGGFAPAAPAPAPAPAPAQQQGSWFPWQQPSAPAPAPAPTNYGAPAPTGAGSSASAQQAQYRCPGATVVWVNEKSHIYHFPGTHDYGNTKRGEYVCEADAQAAGNRAAKNEHRP